MNTQTLKDLLMDAMNHIVAKNKKESKSSFKVYILRYRESGHRVKTSKVIHCSRVLSSTDPRILIAAINHLKKTQLERLRISREELLKIPFELNGSSYIGDTRYGYMDKEEVDVERALGIKDPHPINIWIDTL